MSHNLQGHVIPGLCNTIPEENGKGMLRLSGLSPHLLGGEYSLYWPTQGGYAQIATYSVKAIFHCFYILLKGQLSRFLYSFAKRGRLNACSSVFQNL